ncbi:hypothetical protein Hanom_Chr16g01435981 [Helianthus anomalus]
MVWMFIYKKIRFLYLCNRRSNPSRIGLFYQFHLLISSSYQWFRCRESRWCRPGATRLEAN